MTDRKLLEVVLCALLNYPLTEGKAIQAIKARLAQPEPEPDSVVWDGMTKQPEALRLADGLQKGFPTGSISVQIDQAAAELRRLHEVNAELVEALKKFIKWSKVEANHEGTTFWERVEMLRDLDAAAVYAIAKATGEQQ